ncbi:MAG: hypothetical protein Q9M22_00755 [Mariprofundaceae bacterium]|nr:hypothetical protein [Mariprofundaceae bacterium]
MKPWSNRRLLALFLLALLLFIPLRWDATAWLEMQTQNIREQLPFPMKGGALTWSVKGLTIEHITLILPPPAEPLLFNQLTLSPVWAKWLQGTRAMDVSLSSVPINGQTEIVIGDAYIQLSAMQWTLAVPWLQAQWPVLIPVGIALQGMLEATGDIRFDSQETLPQPIAGTVNLTWKTAGIQLGESVTSLGDYQLLIQDEMPASWQLQLDGGELLKLQGQATLQSQNMPWLQWPLQGQIEMIAAPNSPLSALLGSKKSITLSGTLQDPQWRM